MDVTRCGVFVTGVLLVIALATVREASAFPAISDEPQSDGPVRLRVATKESPPFAFKRADGSWAGISIELWRRVADELGVEYSLQEIELAELTRRLRAGDADLAIAAFSVTAERDEEIDFSHSYYTTGLGIVVAEDRFSTIWNMVHRLLTTRFFEIIGGMVVLGIVTALFFWRVEQKRKHPMFGERPREGVEMGLWWSTIILLGHKGVFPVSTTGRIVAALVMIVSTLAVSVLTGVVASVMTVSRLGPSIGHPEDLRHLRTASVEASTSAEYLTRQRIAFREYPTLEAAFEAVVDGRRDAVVYDVDMLKYLKATDAAESLEVLPFSFHVQQYAIALPPDSELRRPLNQAMLKIIASDEWRDVLFRYLGE